MATKTTKFEMINPYQKYGLKRRPTFNEILGLIEEDQQMLRPFPDRTATQFRNSPQGSFFDGADHIELLKEQQNRVLDRQMRQMMLQKQSRENGQTYHLEQHRDARQSLASIRDARQSLASIRDDSGANTPIETVQGDSGMVTPSEASSSQIYHASSQRRELEQRTRALQERQREVGRRHREAVNRLNDTLTQNMLNRGFTGLLEMPELEEVTQQTEGDLSAEELIPDDEYQGLTVYERGVFNFNNDTQNILDDDRITADGLMFQLFYRDQLNPRDIKDIENEPDEMKQKESLARIINWMIEHDDWETMANQQKLSRKMKEWKNIKKKRGSGVVRQFLSSAGSAASSALSAGLQEVGKGAVKGAISAMTGT